MSSPSRPIVLTQEGSEFMIVARCLSLDFVLSNSRWESVTPLPIKRYSPVEIDALIDSSCHSTKCSWSFVAYLQMRLAGWLADSRSWYPNFQKNSFAFDTSEWFWQKSWAVEFNQTGSQESSRRTYESSRCSRMARCSEGSIGIQAEFKNTIVARVAISITLNASNACSPNRFHQELT